MVTLDQLYQQEKESGLHNRENTTIRTKWINTLRAIVAKDCPTNKVGASLVSDVDLLAATKEQRAEAFRKVFEKP